MFTISASISRILEPSPQGLISSTHNDHDQKHHTHMHVLAKYTPKLSCIGLLDFKTTKIHIPTIRKIHGKIHFAQFQWQFYKAVLSRNAGVYEALLYRRALCSMLGVRLYSLSFLTGVSTVLGLALHSTQFPSAIGWRKKKFQL